MTVHILVSGSLFREPQQRTSQSGKRYVVATLKATTTDNSSSDFWSIMCFSESAGAELLRLGINEKLAVQGSLKIETFEKNGETRISRTIFCDHVLALRAPPKEKKPKAAAAPEKLPLEPVNIMPASAPTFDDDIPF
jgi:single-stranded DNA-binding protein